jgi:glycosyltransferase involved in cell wall biosynthesis
MNPRRISIVIPAKNEARSVGAIIEKSKLFGHEVILIDGHSKDETQNIARKYGVQCFKDNGKGKGAAIQLGIKKAKGDIIVFLDADGSHNPEDIPKLVEPILKNRADMVIASRLRGGSEDFEDYCISLIRTIGSVIITLVINLRWKSKITDSQNGFRAIRTEHARKLYLTENLTTIEQQMVMRCLKKGLFIEEVPIREQKRLYGTSKFTLRKVSLSYLWCLIRELLTK